MINKLPKPHARPIKPRQSAGRRGVVGMEIAFIRKVIQTPAVWMVGLMLAAAAVALTPFHQVHVRTLPSADTKFIRRVWAQHTVGQTFIAAYPTDTVRVLARSLQPQTMTLQLLDKSGGLIGSTTASLSQAERWITFPLRAPLPSGPNQLTLQAPDIVAQEQAALVRFQIDSTSYQEGAMIVDNQESYGDLALELENRIPLGLYVYRWVMGHAPARRVAAGMAVTAPVLYGLLWSVTNKRRFVIGLILLATITIAIRIPTLLAIDGVFGGDAFNYLLKAKAWLAGQDPFAADTRKGPVYSFLLLPILLTPDPILWSRVVGMLLAAAAAVSVALILKRLGARNAIALGGGLLLAVNQDFWFESLSALANVPYAAIVTAALLAYLGRNLLLTGVLSAAAALTRFEGALVAAILLPAAWVQHSITSRRFDVVRVLRRLILPTLLILAIPFVLVPITGGGGVRSLEDIKNDPGLYIAWDWHDYLSNLERFKSFMLDTWLHAHGNAYLFSYGMYGLALAGVIILLRRRPLFIIPLLLIFVTQAAFITEILPKGRYYVQLIPLTVIAVAAVAIATPHRAGLAGLVLLITFVGFSAYHHLRGPIEHYNSKGKADAVLIKAIKSLPPTGEAVGMATDFLPGLIYLSPDRFAPYPAGDDQLAWVREKNIKYVIETSEYPMFTVIKEHPELFRLVSIHHSREGGAVAHVYSVEP